MTHSSNQKQSLVPSNHASFFPPNMSNFSRFLWRPFFSHRFDLCVTQAGSSRRLRFPVSRVGGDRAQGTAKKQITDSDHLCPFRGDSTPQRSSATASLRRHLQRARRPWPCAGPRTVLDTAIGCPVKRLDSEVNRNSRHEDE